MTLNAQQMLESTYVLLFITLHEYRIMCTLSFLFDDLNQWVKPRSLTWFSRFFLTKFNGDRWVEIFWMTKPTLFGIVKKLRPMLKKLHTKHRKTIFIEI